MWWRLVGGVLGGALCVVGSAGFTCCCDVVVLRGCDVECRMQCSKGCEKAAVSRILQRLGGDDSNTRGVRNRLRGDSLMV